MFWDYSYYNDIGELVWSDGPRFNPEDYISNGHNRHPEYNHFQPRLGVAYDVHGDHDLIIFGGAGRYYDESLFIEGQIEQQQNSSVVLNTVNLPSAGFFAACTGGSPPTFCSDQNALRQLIAAQGSAGAVWPSATTGG